MKRSQTHMHALQPVLQCSCLTESIKVQLYKLGKQIWELRVYNLNEIALHGKPSILGPTTTLLKNLPIAFIFCHSANNNNARAHKARTFAF